MRNQPKTIEEVHTALKILRKRPGSHRRFPKQLWDSILELAKHQEICRQLEIHPIYLKQKIQKSQNSQKSLDFQEIFCESLGGHLIDASSLALLV